ncbi:unnamed protein product [Prorocentrum cordatum]|uniref:Uncharacterized protein n=1 Tax=Prorocentrum cordatum TaxID=2364126 RepID=A0ABN9PF36_9DINO|nr:unnamed protein product [Polarella glacialis]
MHCRKSVRSSWIYAGPPWRRLWRCPQGGGSSADASTSRGPPKVCAYALAGDSEGEASRETAVPETDRGDGSVVRNETERSVTITNWYGRIGNNIIQVVNAILFCQANGYEKLKLPADMKNLNHLFDMPNDIAIVQRTMDDSVKLTCKWNPPYMHWFFGRCMSITKGIFKRTMEEYLVPHLTNSTAAACRQEHGHPFNGLTIHLRSGDTARQSMHTSQTAYASCSFFEKVIYDQKFTAARVVTEADLSHPCIPFLRTRLPEMGVPVSFESSTIEQDACALMNARYLAFGSWSTFSQTLELLNDRVAKSFLPVPPEGTIAMDNHCDKVVRGQRPRTYIYQIDGMENGHHDMTTEDSVNYFSNMPMHQVTLKAVCNLMNEVPFVGSVSLR